MVEVVLVGDEVGGVGDGGADDAQAVVVVGEDEHAAGGPGGDDDDAGDAGDAGEVIDRHTGRHWPAALLGEWLAVAGLLSRWGVTAQISSVPTSVSRAPSFTGISRSSIFLPKRITAFSGAC